MNLFLLLWLFMLIHVNLFSQTDNEFWFAAPEISYQFSSASGVTSNHRDRPIQLVLTCFDQRAHVTICQPANLNFPIIHKIVPADTFLIVDLTQYIDIIENKPADSVLPYGLLITSDNPITANYEITHYSTPYGNGAMYVLKGKNALGYDFIIPSQTLYPNFPYCDPPARNCFDIVAVEDSTQITITPSSIITGHPAGVPFNITLNRGESWEGRAVNETILGHLNGTTITSNKPIAVTVSDDNIFVNSQPQFTDLAGDQLIPSNIAGTEYGDVEEYFSHTISICAFNDGTNVYHNGFFALSLNKGQCINYQVNTGAHYFNSNKPVMLYSNFIHPAFNEAGGTVLASLTCNGSKKVILPTPIVDSGSQGEAHEIIIITKEDNTIRTVINGSSVTIPSNLFYPLPGTGGTWVYTAMTTGTVGYPQYFYGSQPFILDVGNKGPGLSSYYKLGCISNYSTINLGPDRHICPGDSLKLDAGYGHDSIQWSNGDTTRTIMINSPGTFYVTVFDNDGCIHSDTIQITNFTISNPLNLGPDVVLCSDSIMLNAGTGRFSYLWNTGDTTQSIWIKTPGVYSVAVISNPELCLLRDTIEVLPSGVQQINIGNDTSICRHDTIQLDAGDGMDSYLWNTGETSRKIWVKSEGMYFVTAQKYSCIYTDTIVITYKQTPVVNLGPDVSICIGQVQTFDAGFCTGCTYSWDDLSTNQMNIGTNQTYITGQAGIYRVTVTGSNGCHNRDTVQLLTIAGVHVTIAVTSSLNNVCQGTSVTFSAHTTNGGVLPFFQWKVNGVGVGLDDSIFTYVPLNGDIVNCTLTSSNTICVLNNPATSNSLSMIVTLAPSVTFTSCFDTITTINAKPIKLKGGIPLGGTYSGPGVNSITSVFTPSAAGTGIKAITYSYTNAALCSASKSRNIIVQTTAVFTCGNNLTDIRDNKSYPTVQIGSQCWLASNLNFGTTLSSTQDQRDNCVPEKYCYNDNPTNCLNHGGLYQWDELMLFDETPADQGFCPPGWHIPTENEWNILFANYINSGFAGSPLKYSGYSGFNALLSGARHINKGWDFQGFATFFWSSTTLGSTKAWAHGMNDVDPSVSHYPASRVNAFSVRCLKD